MTFTDENWREWLLLLERKLNFAVSQISLITPLIDSVELVKGRLDALNGVHDASRCPFCGPIIPGDR